MHVGQRTDGSLRPRSLTSTSGSSKGSSTPCTKVSSESKEIDLTRASTTTPSRRRMIWTGSSVTRRECTNRSIGQFSDFWSPRKDEPHWTTLPVRHSLNRPKMKNEANKS
jgi:hypothetical protein